MSLTLNIPKAQRLYKHLEDNPEQHFQGVWYEENPTCGTTACAAGWQAILDGADIVRNTWTDTSGTYSYASASTVLIDGVPVGIDVYARKSLGLTKEEADRIFYRSETEGQAITELGCLINMAVAAQGKQVDA